MGAFIISYLMYPTLGWKTLPLVLGFQLLIFGWTHDRL